MERGKQSKVRLHFTKEKGDIARSNTCNRIISRFKAAHVNIKDCTVFDALRSRSPSVSAAASTSSTSPPPPEEPGTAEPLPLMDLCRCSVRVALGRDRLTEIQGLPLPASLKNYLLYQ